MITQIAFRTSRAIAVGTIATALTAAGLPALAASETGATDTLAIEGGWANPTMARLAESSGRLLLERIETAQKMIGSGKYKAARNELDAAEDTAGAIRTMMPFMLVVENIKDAKNKLLVEDVAQFEDDLLPIYAQLDQMSVVAPKVAKDAKEKLKQAENKAKNGKSMEAGKAMDEATESITATAVYLPVDYVYGQVAAARIALSATVPDAATAKRAVDNAEKSLVTVVTTIQGQPKG